MPSGREEFGAKDLQYFIKTAARMAPKEAAFAQLGIEAS
jgi:hypothetical protein